LQPWEHGEDLLCATLKYSDIKVGFSQGLAAAAVSDEGSGTYWHYGFINHQGVWVIQPTYDDVQPHSENLAAVCLIDRQKFPKPPQSHHLFEKAYHP
jgi:hypothetical protein